MLLGESQRNDAVPWWHPPGVAGGAIHLSVLLQFVFKFTPGCSAPAGPITRCPISPSSALPPSPIPGLHPWASVAGNFGAVGRWEDEHHLPASSPRVFSSGIRSEGDKEQAAVTNAPFAPLPKRARGGTDL